MNPGSCVLPLHPSCIGTAEETALLHWKLNPNTGVVCHCCFLSVAGLWHNVCMLLSCMQYGSYYPNFKIGNILKGCCCSWRSVMLYKIQIIIPEEDYLEQTKACFYSNNNQKRRNLFIFPKGDRVEGGIRRVWMNWWMWVSWFDDHFYEKKCSLDARIWFVICIISLKKYENCRFPAVLYLIQYLIRDLNDKRWNVFTVMSDKRQTIRLPH